MYARLTAKDSAPTAEEFTSHIGSKKELFACVDGFLVHGFGADTALKFDAHSQCWKINYRAKKEYICDIIAESDAFTFVTRLSEESIQSIYESVSAYAKECIDKSPFRHRGWIEYRVLEAYHLDDIQQLAQIRTSGKQKSMG